MVNSTPLLLLSCVSGVSSTAAGVVGVVDLWTSPVSLVGEDSDRLSSALGVVDPLTSGVESIGGDIDLLTSAEGVVDLLTSDIGGTGSVDTYLLDSDTVESGGVVTLRGMEVGGVSGTVNEEGTESVLV